MGYMIHGTHAEYVPHPFADTSLYHLPEGLNEDVRGVSCPISCQLHMKLACAVWRCQTR